MDSIHANAEEARDPQMPPEHSPEPGINLLEEVERQLEEIHSASLLAERSFVRVALLLNQVKRAKLWRLKGYRSEQDWIDKVFPQSPAQYYELVRIARQLGQIDQKILEEIGRRKCAYLARLRIHLNGELPGEWIEKARSMDSSAFMQEVRNIIGADKDKPSAAITTLEDAAEKRSGADYMFQCRIFGNDIHVVKTAFERLAQIAGSEKSYGYLLSLLCADFLSGYTEDGEGNVQRQNAFILRIISSLLDQLDYEESDIADRLLGLIAAKIEKYTQNA